MLRNRVNLQIVVMLAVVAVIVGLIVYRSATMEFAGAKQGYFRASKYPKLVQDGRWTRYGLPSSLPANARNTVIYAPASVPARLPSPDQYVEVRFILPPSDAQALAVTAAKVDAQLAKPSSSYGGFLNGLHTAHDANMSTPLPPSYKSFMLTNPSGMNVGGVTIDTTSGEVVYWIFEF